MVSHSAPKALEERLWGSPESELGVLPGFTTASTAAYPHLTSFTLRR
jgi:hypothetical protein